MGKSWDAVGECLVIGKRGKTWKSKDRLQYWQRIPGWWFQHPRKIIPSTWENKNVPNHQPEFFVPRYTRASKVMLPSTTMIKASQIIWTNYDISQT